MHDFVFSDCIATILDVGAALEPGLLESYPKLKSFLERMLALPAFDGVKDFPLYHKPRLNYNHDSPF